MANEVYDTAVSKGWGGKPAPEIHSTLHAVPRSPCCRLPPAAPAGRLVGAAVPATDTSSLTEEIIPDPDSPTQVRLEQTAVRRLHQGWTRPCGKSEAWKSMADGES